MFTRLGTISKRIGNISRNSLALVGLGTTIYGISQYKEYKQVTSATGNTTADSSAAAGGDFYSYFTNYKNDTKDDDNGGEKGQKGQKEKNQTTTIKEKKILHLPFHKMKIIERKKNPTINQIFEKEDDIIEVEIQHLIHIIHEAANDPNIVALYGTFGNGFRFDCGGYSHVEEIRNAIRVFNESHRRHYDRPSTAAGTNSDDSTNDSHDDHPPEQKYSYAFADTFDHPIDSGNKEYYLASSFSDIILQQRGNLNLFGVSTSNTFVLRAFEKYGIKAHVFKHGKYKSEFYYIYKIGNALLLLLLLDEYNMYFYS